VKHSVPLHLSASKTSDIFVDCLNINALPVFCTLIGLFKGKMSLNINALPVFCTLIGLFKGKMSRIFSVRPITFMLDYDINVAH
jgi:hypothetical protein